MIQRLLLTSFFINNKTKPNQTKHHNWILSLLKQLHVSSSLLYYITIHVFASMSLPYFGVFINHALDFCKVRIKLLGLTFKGKQNIFPNQQPLSSAASYLHYKATMMPIAIHSQQETLICTITQQGSSLAVAQVVLSFLLSCWFLHSECEKQWMQAYNVMHRCWIITDICA